MLPLPESPPKMMCPHQVPGTCVCDLIWKRFLCQCTEDFKMKFAGIIQVRKCHDKYPPRRKEVDGRLAQRRCNVMAEADIGVTRPWGHRQGEDPAPESPEGAQLAGETSGLQKYEGMNSHCFETPSIC